MLLRIRVFVLLVGLVALPGGVAAQGSPVASGTSIVYQTMTNGREGIWTMALDGTHPVELALGVDGDKLHPDWSPDGARIVFEVLHGELGELWTIGADGEGAALLYACAAPCIRMEYPAWSPVGGEIAFVTLDDLDGVAGPPDATALQVLDLASGTVREVVRTEFPTLMTGPRWSGDGTRLAIGVEHIDADGNDLGSTIALVDAAGGALTEVTDPAGFAFYPDWNAAGDAIVFDQQTVQYAMDPSGDAKTWNLFVMSPDGSGLRQITNVAQGTKLFQPSWTPDGKRVIATMDGPDGRMLVWVDVESGAVEVISGRLATHGRVGLAG